LHDWETYDWTFHHGMGVATFDAGTEYSLRIAVTHLAPSNPPQRFSEAHYVTRLGDPRQHTIIAADWNCPGEDPSYDPDPDWLLLDDHEVARRALWNDDPIQPLTVDRRPARLLHQAGLIDVARHLKRPWQASTFNGDRFDAFRASTCVLPTVVDCGVLDAEAHMRLSDHYPIWMTHGPSLGQRPSVGGMRETSNARHDPSNYKGFEGVTGCRH
jgi:hypothetical protein